MTVPLALTIVFGLGAAVGALAVFVVLEWQHRRWVRQQQKLARRWEDARHG